MTRAVIGWKSVLYKSIEHRAELKLHAICQIVLFPTFPGLLSSFFSFTESEPASSNRTTKQRFVNILGAVI